MLTSLLIVHVHIEELQHYMSTLVTARVSDLKGFNNKFRSVQSYKKNSIFSAICIPSLFLTVRLLVTKYTQNKLITSYLFITCSMISYNYTKNSSSLLSDIKL